DAPGLSTPRRHGPQATAAGRLVGLRGARSGPNQAGRPTALGGTVVAVGTIYAIANQKGGVGKTTTAGNVAACLAEAGYSTLLVDLDPQANATVGLGAPKESTPSSYDVLAGRAAAAEALRPTAVEGLQLLPSHPDLAGAAVELPRQPGSEG